MRRLVFITQRVDEEDPILAATIPKIRALAARVDDVFVLAQSGRGEGLPANVELRTFGARDRIARAARFERELARGLPADAVIAHMIPLYVVLGAPLVRRRRIPLLLWYTQWKASLTLRAAERLATAVVSVERRSFPLHSTKVHGIGHGIDVHEFSCADRSAHTGLRVLVLGRYSPSKGLGAILDAVRRVDGAEIELYGAALTEQEHLHRRALERFGVELHDAVPRARLPELFARADVLVSNTEAGSSDKVVFEAAASCLPVLSSNPVLDELLAGFPLAFARNDPACLADRLSWLAELDPAARAEIGRTLRERVVRRHSVETWADGILEVAA
jgi:glycosyltransferase involved in cell wall biosynthesis